MSFVEDNEFSDYYESFRFGFKFKSKMHYDLLHDLLHAERKLVKSFFEETNRELLNYGSD
jgi:hypothetical protein